MLFRSVAALLAAGAKPTFYDKNMRTALHEAAEVGSLTATKLLIEAGANVDARNNDRETPLHIACKGGWSKLIELFVSCKADVTALDERLNTPLHLLLSSDTYHDELELVKASIELLLKSGADINAQNRKKLTPLLTLLQKDHYFGAERPEKLVEFMIGKGAKLDSIDGGPSILHSLKWDSPEIAKVCIAAGTPVDGADDSGRTPLHMAAAHGLFEVAGVLVSSGANINARDHDGLTPLHQVLIHTQSRSPIKIFKFLLDSGADIEAVANDGSSVMAIAIRSNIHTAVRLLLDRGAKIADADESGLTPLHLAASLGSIDAAEVLLKAGADPDAVDKQQMTPVLYALAFGDKDLLKLLDPDGTRCRSGLEKLIQNGGELNTTAEGGKQMIHGAAELNQTWAISALLEAGVSPDEQCEGRTTAIGYAAMTDSVEAAKLLISANADLERADEAAALPTAIALKHWSFEVLRLLVQAGASKPDMKRFWGGPGYSGIGSLPPDIQELLTP